MQIGIRDTMLPVPFEDTFTEAKELGFDGLEFRIGDDYQDHLLFSEAGIEKVQDLIDSSGCSIAALTAQALIPRTFLNPNDDLRLEGIRFVDYLSRVAPRLGAKVIVLPFFEGATLSSEHAVAPRLVDGLKRTGEVAAQSGVTLALECTLSGEEQLRLLEAVAMDAVALCYDVGNAVGMGYDAVREIRSLTTKHIVYVHMKDTDTQHLGEGRVDFQATSEAIKEIDYEGWFVLETPAGVDSFASAKKNLEFTKRFVTDIQSSLS
jgi:sugar phosphate isomerase/epimerase